MVILQLKLILLFPLQNLWFATYLVYYLALLDPYALEKGFTNFFQTFQIKILASPSLRLHFQAPQ
jgi:hypothetical protein